MLAHRDSKPKTVVGYFGLNQQIKMRRLFERLTIKPALMYDSIMTTQSQEKIPSDSNTVRTAFEEGIPSASIEVHGDKWCVWGNSGVGDLVDDALVFGERRVFGFALVE